MTERIFTSVGSGPRGKVLRGFGTVVAGVVIVAGGFGYRLAATVTNAELAKPIRLDRPLMTLPMVIGPWRGEDIEIPENVLRIAGNDDYLSRQYRNAHTGDCVSLYVGYTARPRTMLRHRPTVCYSSAGWSHLGTREVELTSDHRLFPALVHTFLKPSVHEQRHVVLNYYVLNGRVTIDEQSFWSIGWRDPNLRRDASRYVAQVQITAIVSNSSSVDRAEDSVKRFAIEVAPKVGDLLPVRGSALSGQP